MKFMAPFRSDRRAKHNIKFLMKLSNGVKIYKFSYLGNSKSYVGVMAQDLLLDERFKNAVIENSAGLFVDYQKLGIRFVTYEAWKKHGVKSIFIEDTSFTALPIVETRPR